MSSRTQKLKRCLFYALLLLLIAFQIQDGYWTFLGVSRYGIFAEGNPLILWIFQVVGVLGGLILAKSVGVFFIGVIFLLCRAEINTNVLVYLILINMFYGWSAYRWYMILF